MFSLRCIGWLGDSSVKVEFKELVTRVFTFDFVGALLASLIFPLILVPYVFLSIIFLLAFLEEGLWDMTVWKEHKSVFSWFHFSDFKFSHEVLSLIVPLLALPQITHYIVDGYIWRVRKDKSLQ